MPAAVVLAAGSSTRLGTPKQKLMFNGEMLVQRAARIAREAGFSPVFVVVPEVCDFGPQLSDAKLVANANAAEGIASSIRAGVAAAVSAHADGVILLTCDQIHLRAAHLRALVSDHVTGSAYAGRIGIPAYFPATALPLLSTLSGDFGARDMLKHAAYIRDEDLAVDIDTPQDWHNVLADAAAPTDEKIDRPHLCDPLV